ncbi:hypothetical protein [Nocardioides convexus]|uniref:hypothetical protein n=1 Tax=Nocardioides convexus TaxID=2712224 RepID=UPI00241859DB|nr:hypothetical protein [Nocardioides convexus]
MGLIADTFATGGDGVPSPTDVGAHGLALRIAEANPRASEPAPTRTLLDLWDTRALGVALTGRPRRFSEPEPARARAGAALAVRLAGRREARALPGAQDRRPVPVLHDRRPGAVGRHGLLRAPRASYRRSGPGDRASRRHPRHRPVLRRGRRRLRSRRRYDGRGAGRGRARRRGARSGRLPRRAALRRR